MEIDEKPERIKRVCEAGHKLTKICQNMGGRLYVCNRVGITIQAYEAYRSGTLKMTKKIKKRFFDQFGVEF